MTDTVRVPREPTEAMLANGREALLPLVRLDSYGPLIGLWRDMLAASPQGEGSSADPAPIKPSADTGELRGEVIAAVVANVHVSDGRTFINGPAIADAILDLIQSERGKSMTAQELAEHAQFAFENDLPDDFTPYDCAMAWRRVGEHLAAVLAERAEDGGMRDTNLSRQSIKEIARQLQQYAANTLKP